jgi:hypothetical protein
VFLYPGAIHTLLTLKDIYHSGYHVTSTCEDGVEYLHIIVLGGCEAKVVEKALGMSSMFYYSRIKPPLEFGVISTIFRNPKSFRVWHERLGHPRLRMTWNIITSSISDVMKTIKIDN